MKSPIQILLVEDSDGDAFLLDTGMRKSGVPHVLNRVHDGSEGINFLLQKPPFTNSPKPDLIITDIRMPRMDGIEFLRELKKFEDLRSIPVCVLIGSESHGQIIRSQFDCPAECFIIKGIEPISVKLQELFANPATSA